MALAALIRVRTVPLLGTLFLLAACAGPPQSLPPEWEILEGDPGGLSVSQPALLIADNQLHNLYADPVELRRTGAANRLVPSAIRPAQLDLYGPSFLEHVVEKQGDDMPVLHLGDACDLSCSGEFARFVAIMRGSRHGWMMAPGNHDGYLFGNEQADTGGRLWQAACRNSGVAMNKALFVRLYLAALMIQADPGCRAVAARLRLEDRLPPDEGRALPLDALERLLGDLGRAVPSEGRWPEAGEPRPIRSLLRRIRWKIEEDAPCWGRARRAGSMRSAPPAVSRSRSPRTRTRAATSSMESNWRIPGPTPATATPGSS